MAKYKLGEIYGELKLKSTEWNNKLQSSQSKMKAFGKATAKAFIAVAAVIGGASLAIAKLIKDTIKYGVETDKFAKQTGMLTGDVQRLRYAFEQEHASFETLTKAFPILTKYMDYSRKGMDTYKREFDKMGISVVNGSGKLKSAYDVFLEMSDWMSQEGIPDTDKLAVATNLLGRRGADLIPVMKKGREWLQKMGEEAERLGLVLDRDMVRTLKETDDSITKMNGSMRGFKMTMSTQMIPALNVALRQWTDWGVTINKVSREILQMSDKEQLSNVLGKTGETVVKMNARLRESKAELKTLEEQGITSGQQYEHLSKTIEVTTEKIHELTGKAKTLFVEGLNPYKYSIDEVTDAFKGKTAAIEEQNKTEEEMMVSLKGLEMIVPNIANSIKGMGKETYGFVGSLEEVDAVIAKPKGIKDNLQLINMAASQLGAVMGQVFGKAKMGADEFLKSLVKIGLQIAGMAIGGPAGGFLGGLLGGLFAEGGVAIPRGTAPVFAAEGMVVANKPTMSPAGNIFAEDGTEIFMKGNQWTEFIKSMKPNIIIHEAGPTTWVEVLENGSQGDLQRLGRLMEDKGLASQRELG